jgi:hypothetical protein
MRRVVSLVCCLPWSSSHVDHVTCTRTCSIELVIDRESSSRTLFMYTFMAYVCYMFTCV